MIRPLRITIATLGVIAGMLIGSGHAQASATCSLHDVSIDWWAPGADQINGSTHMKCGGAQSGHNGDYYIHYYLQDAASSSGPWVTVGCINGQYCDATRPTGSPCPNGLYCGGVDYPTNFWTFNVNGQIECQWWRIHVVVVFPLIDQVGPNYNDNQWIGGC